MTAPYTLDDARRQMRDWVNGNAAIDRATLVAKAQKQAAWAGSSLTENDLTRLASSVLASVGVNGAAHEDDDEPEVPIGSLGGMSGFDLPYGPPPPQLADPYCTPEGVTILYGKGGVGKGTVTAWLISRLMADGHTVLLLDYEHHQREWGGRLRGLGVTPEHLKGRVHWRSPSDPTWVEPGGTLEAHFEEVRAEAVRIGATYLVIDSYTMAAGGDEALGGVGSAQAFFKAVTSIGLPALVIAHVQKSAERFASHPFGSAFVHNLARETWAVEFLTEPEPGYTPPQVGVIAVAKPAVIELELRNQKANTRAKAPPQFLTFEFFANGEISVSTTAPAGRSVADLVGDVLRGGKRMTPKAIAAAIKEDTGQVIKDDTLGKTLRRMADTRVLGVNRDKRPHTYFDKDSSDSG